MLRNVTERDQIRESDRVVLRPDSEKRIIIIKTVTAMFVNSITSFGIIDVIDGFKCNKSCGDDGFQSNLIKDNTMILCEPLV